MELVEVFCVDWMLLLVSSNDVNWMACEDEELDSSYVVGIIYWIDLVSSPLGRIKKKNPT